MQTDSLAVEALQTFVLPDNTSLRVRYLHPSDKPAIKQFLARCSYESLRFRFLHPIKALSEEDMDRLLNVDGSRHLALTVWCHSQGEDQIVAVGRYHAVPERPTVADVSFLVEDAMQRRGIGTRLLQMLAALAQQHGITRFSADVLSDNILMLNVFRHAGYALTSATSYGVTHLEFSLTTQQPAS